MPDEIQYVYAVYVYLVDIGSRRLEMRVGILLIVNLIYIIIIRFYFIKLAAGRIDRGRYL